MPIFSFQKNLSYFAPYLFWDTIFLYLSVVLILFAILIQHKTAFRNAVIFSLKFYPSSCIYSLYKKIGGKQITFSSYSSFICHPLQINDPTVRLPRSETDSSKLRVSFQSVTEEMPPSSLSEPNVSPHTNQPKEETVLKSCCRKSLPLPINLSYP